MLKTYPDQLLPVPRSAVPYSLFPTSARSLVINSVLRTAINKMVNPF
ncbi:MAG: hypothetical protein F6K50_36195 [Moorea sp. SIO3I7]|nr:MULTISPECIES: hypothetical protein [unclassified Moorena]NEO00687.1 hypothetical protein [Moorena sp. SIO3I7]NEO14328.1 hypothetical protein [Moorena sp. SIO3E8]NEP20610.1 hypothetical protein [Moorena sp. SIO3I6]NEQ00381.1 hypothetical protein [Moorena sp. SIO3F7]